MKDSEIAQLDWATSKGGRKITHIAVGVRKFQGLCGADLRFGMDTDAPIYGPWLVPCKKCVRIWERSTMTRCPDVPV